MKQRCTRSLVRDAAEATTCVKVLNHTVSYTGHYKDISYGKEAYSSLCYKHCTATRIHVPYGITQYYLPPGRGDIPVIITPSQLRLVLDLATPEDARLS